MPPSFPYRRVSVSGVTGTVASQFVPYLLNEVPGVAAVTTSCRQGSAARARRVPQSSKLRVLEGSLQDIDMLRALVDAGDIVYHLAAWLANTSLPEDANEVYSTNSLATAVIARLCERRHRPLVFTSSHSVYFAGNYAGRIKEDTFVFRRDFVDWIEQVRHAYYAYADELIAGTAQFAGASPRLDAIHAELPPPFEPLIYDRDEYHIYCLTKLLAERFVLDHGGVVLRLSNVYGPGDESLQAVGEACHRIMTAEPGASLAIRQPFKKLVPACLPDIIQALLRAAALELPEDVAPVFTVASQEHYLREDDLLRTAAQALNELRDTAHGYDIEPLPPETSRAFTYDLTKLRTWLLPDTPLTPFADGLKQQLAWRLNRG